MTRLIAHRRAIAGLFCGFCVGFFAGACATCVFPGHAACVACTNPGAFDPKCCFGPCYSYGDPYDAGYGAGGVGAGGVDAGVVDGGSP